MADKCTPSLSGSERGEQEVAEEMETDGSRFVLALGS